MHIPEEAPPLNPWPFLFGDVALIATACYIASDAQAPLAGAPLFAIAGCVGLGAVLAAIPFLLNQARQQDLLQAVRQREMAALTLSSANAAEQIGTAIAGLAKISEENSRAVKLVEALPHRLQDKINEFKTQLNEVAVNENEALAQEINTLRASETERLESALAGVRKAAADLNALEASVRKQARELNDALAASAPAAERAAGTVAKAIESALRDSEKALAQAREAATAALQNAVAAALADIDRKVSALASKLPASSGAGDSAPLSLPAAPAPAAPAPIPEPFVPEKLMAETPVEKEIPSEPEGFAPAATASAVERVAAEPAAAAPEAPAEPQALLTDEPIATAKPVPAAEDVPSAAPEKPAKRRSRRQPDNELSLGLEVTEPPVAEFSQIAPEPSKSAVSADGVTRLLVTAYIGIGNKLFVRGEGPGLSWDRGVPLQFVSIGKWRWESAEADAPVKLKLYKNDEIECASVGQVTIAPGHQLEAAASFS